MRADPVPTVRTIVGPRQPRVSPSGAPLLQEVGEIFARGYLRLLAQRSAMVDSSPQLGSPPKPVDSVRNKCLNWLDQDGGRDA
jgi:hypothetical protein